MAHWCLRDVNYDTLDFLSKATLESKYPKEARSSDKAPTSGYKEAGDEFVFHLQPREHEAKSTNYRSSSGGGVRGHVIGGTVGMVQANDKSYGATWAAGKLREALMSKERKREVPQCIATWPLETLKLQDILCPEECDRIFSSPDELWTLFFQGLLLLSPLSQLQHLDLTGYVPSRGLQITILQLIPLLTLPIDNLDTSVILDTVISTLKLDISSEESLLKNMTSFIDTQLKHNLFKRGRQILLPRGHLKVTMDFVTLSSARLSLLGLLMCKGLEPRSRIDVCINSMVFRYNDRCGRGLETVDPLLGLAMLEQLLPKNGLQGLVLECIPQFAIPSVFGYLHRAHHLLGSIKQFGFTHSPLDCTDSTTKKHLEGFFSHLTHLKRLDLTGSKIDGELENILDPCKSALDYLNLSHCNLNIKDLDTLFSSSVTSHIQDLDLSYVYSSVCMECSDRFNAVVDCLDASSDLHQRDSGYYSHSRDSSRVSSPSVDTPTATVEDMNVWTFWKFLSGRSTSEYSPPKSHVADQDLIHSIVNKLVSLPNLAILEMGAISFEFRIPNELLLELLTTIKTLKRLKHFSIEDIPLWEEDVYLLCESAVANPKMQSLALTRSLDAPKMETQEKILFWKRMYKIRGERVIRMSLGNYSDKDILCYPEAWESGADVSSFTTCS